MKLHTHKDRPDPSGEAGVYWIPCTCGKVYIGETGGDLTTRPNEHKAHSRKGECDKSAIIKHSTDLDHIIDWQKAEIIAPEKHWYTRRIREAIAIHTHDTVPQDIGYFISSIWHSILPSISTHTPQSTDTPQRAGNPHTHTHTQTCKHRQTGSSHCSSFVYTLTFSQHLSYVLYTFGKRGPFSNWGPYCSFCYKSPVWMPKQTHTPLYTPANLWGTPIVFSIVYTLTCLPTPLIWISTCGVNIVPLNFLVGYPIVPIVASTPQPMAYAFTHAHGGSTHHKHVHSIRHMGSTHCTNRLFRQQTFLQHLSHVLNTFGNQGHFFQLGTL